jgi:hypothetical protein
VISDRIWLFEQDYIQDKGSGITDKIKMNEAAGWEQRRFLLYGDSILFESLLE